jgi:hypothetical protein
MRTTSYNYMKREIQGEGKGQYLEMMEGGGERGACKRGKIYNGASSNKRKHSVSQSLSNMWGPR